MITTESTEDTEKIDKKAFAFLRALCGECL
jgi:hypothetical protein